MSKNKKNTKNKPLRKLLIIALIVGILTPVLWYTWQYTKPENFPIKRVEIFATYQHVNKKSLQDIIATYTNNGFFYINVIGLKKRLLGIPWIQAVSITRKWPDTLIVNVAEQHASLQWGTTALINPKGIIFTPLKNSFPHNLPIIHGPENQTLEIFNLYHKMLAALDPLDLNIKKLILKPRHYWEITLNNNIVVYLKEKNPLEQLELLTSLYRKITANQQKTPKYFDLRYQSGLAVKWE